MTQNPYAQTRLGGDDFSGMPAPARMSVLAVISLVCGIIGCVPPLFLFAILLGVAAIFLIAGSKGRVRGTGLAIGGVVLGLIFTAMWVFIGIGAASVAQELNKSIIVPSQTALTGLEKGDRTALRNMLSPTAKTSVTDAQIDQFASEVKAEFGSFRAVPDSFMDLFEAWKRIGQAMGQANQSGPGQQFNNMIPWPVEFEKGQALLLLEIDNRASKGGLSFHNIGVARPDMTKEVWLVPRGAGVTTPTSTPGASTTPPSTPSTAPSTPPSPPASPDKPDETKQPEKKEPGTGGGG